MGLREIKGPSGQTGAVVFVFRASCLLYNHTQICRYLRTESDVMADAAAFCPDIFILWSFPWQMFRFCLPACLLLQHYEATSCTVYIFREGSLDAQVDEDALYLVTSLHFVHFVAHTYKSMAPIDNFLAHIYESVGKYILLTRNSVISYSANSYLPASLLHNVHIPTTTSQCTLPTPLRPQRPNLHNALM